MIPEAASGFHTHAHLCINMHLHERITCVKTCMYLYVQHDILKFIHSVVWLNLDGFHVHYLTYISVKMGSPSVFPFISPLAVLAMEPRPLDF